MSNDEQCAREILSLFGHSPNVCEGNRDAIIEIIRKHRKPKEPCGECHIQPDETCDMCGARYPTEKEKIREAIKRHSATLNRLASLPDSEVDSDFFEQTLSGLSALRSKLDSLRAAGGGGER